MAQGTNGRRPLRKFRRGHIRKIAAGGRLPTLNGKEKRKAILTELGVQYPQWTGHRDRRGIPIYVYVIKGLDSKHVNKYQKESQTYKDSLPSHKKLQTPAKLLPLFALYQNLLTFVLPLVSTLERPNPEVPVTNSTNIVDITGVGLTQFWNLKNHMQDASILATAHYPETLDRIFVRFKSLRSQIRARLMRNRLLVLRPSFPRFGAGSNDGSTLSQYLKSSS